MNTNQEEHSTGAWEEGKQAVRPPPAAEGSGSTAFTAKEDQIPKQSQTSGDKAPRVSSKKDVLSNTSHDWAAAKPPPSNACSSQSNAAGMAACEISGGTGGIEKRQRALLLEQTEQDGEGASAASLPPDPRCDGDGDTAIPLFQQLPRPLPSASETVASAATDSTPGAYLSGGFLSGSPPLRLATTSASVLSSSRHLQPMTLSQLGGQHSTTRSTGECPTDHDATGLVLASPVPDSSSLPLPIAVPEGEHAIRGSGRDVSSTNTNVQHHDKSQQEKSSQRKKRVYIVIAGILAIVSLAVLVSLRGTGIIGTSSNNDENTINATGPVSPALLGNNSLYVTTYLTENNEWETLEALQNQSSPQFRAAQWLQTDPSLQGYPDYRLRQRFALAVFYYATNGDWWTSRRDWLSLDRHECEWSMTRARDMFAIWYEEESPCTITTSLEGTKDQEANETTITTVKYQDQSEYDQIYKHFYMRNNSLAGSIPNEFYWLSNLQGIEWGLNALSGTLSTAMGLLSSLEYLSLPSNHVSGTIPTELGLLQNLTVFHIGRAGNQFSGPFPSELGQCTKLEQLGLSNSPLTGTIPSELGKLGPALKTFGLSGTQITGSIPSEFGLLTNLGYTYLFANQLSGSLPSEVGLCTKLSWFWIINNGISGAVPSEFGELTGMQELHMSHNSLSSTIPSLLSRLDRLYTLRLESNSLTGSIPESLGNLTNLKTLNLSSNALTSTIPSALGNLTLTAFDISENALLGGTIPESLCGSSHVNFDCSKFLCGCTCDCIF